MVKPLLPNPKPKTDRSKKYLAFVRAKRCLFCNNKAEPHHESGLGDSGGVALKCSDFFAVQLCRFHHDERERLGFDTFWGVYYKDPWNVVIDNLLEYIELNDKRINVKRMIIDFLIERIKQCR